MDNHEDNNASVKDISKRKSEWSVLSNDATIEG